MKKIFVIIIIVFGILLLGFTKIFAPLLLMQSSYDLYNRFFDFAVKTRNPGICNFIFFGQLHGDYGTSASESRYFCKARYGGRLGDIDYCLKLDNSVKYKGTASQQYICFKEMLESVSNIEICDKLPTDTYPVNARYECYSKVAEKTKDAAICQQIPEQGYDRNFRGSRKNCLIAIGRKLSSSEVCRYLTETWVVNECKKAVEAQ
ncbi:hypothetical protein ACFLZ1_03485 [Patescibacteria group bacterium]